MISKLKFNFIDTLPIKTSWHLLAKLPSDKDAFVAYVRPKLTIVSYARVSHFGLACKTWHGTFANLGKFCLTSLSLETSTCKKPLPNRHTQWHSSKPGLHQAIGWITNHCFTGNETRREFKKSSLIQQYPYQYSLSMVLHEATDCLHTTHCWSLHKAIQASCSPPHPKVLYS